MTKEELQQMINELPDKKFAKLSDKRLEYIENSKNKKFSENTKKRISLSKKGKKFNENHIKKLSESHKGQIAYNKGKPFSEESRKKMSESHKGKPPNNKGKKMSEEQRLKLSIIHKGRKPNFVLTDEIRKKMSDSQKGKKHSEETKLKIGSFHKGRTHGKPVECFEYPSMKYICDFVNLTTACMELKINRDAAQMTCTGVRKHTSGYTFKYKDIS